MVLESSLPHLTGLFVCGTGPAKLFWDCWKATATTYIVLCSPMTASALCQAPMISMFGTQKKKGVFLVHSKAIKSKFSQSRSHMTVHALFLDPMIIQSKSGMQLPGNLAWSHFLLCQIFARWHAHPLGFCQPHHQAVGHIHGWNHFNILRAYKSS